MAESPKIITTEHLLNFWNGFKDSLHTHSNKSVLDDTTASFTETDKLKLDGIETGANKYVHPGGTNPHGTTKSDVGLSNVPNVKTNDQTVTYTAADSNTELMSGEKMSVAFGKIAKAISSLISHLTNTANPHSVTKAQVGLATVEDKSSAVIRSEITAKDISNALGAEPVVQVISSTEPSDLAVNAYWIKEITS